MPYRRDKCDRSVNRRDRSDVRRRRWTDRERSDADRRRGTSCNDRAVRSADDEIRRERPFAFRFQSTSPTNRQRNSVRCWNRPGISSTRADWCWSAWAMRPTEARPLAERRCRTTESVRRTDRPNCPNVDDGRASVNFSAEWTRNSCSRRIRRSRRPIAPCWCRWWCRPEWNERHVDRRWSREEDWERWGATTCLRSMNWTNSGILWSQRRRERRRWRGIKLFDGDRRERLTSVLCCEYFSSNQLVWDNNRSAVWGLISLHSLVLVIHLVEKNDRLNPLSTSSFERLLSLSLFQRIRFHHLSFNLFNWTSFATTENKTEQIVYSSSSSSSLSLGGIISSRSFALPRSFESSSSTSANSFGLKRMEHQFFVVRSFDVDWPAVLRSDVFDIIFQKDLNDLCFHFIPLFDVFHENIIA